MLSVSSAELIAIYQAFFSLLCSVKHRILKLIDATLLPPEVNFSFNVLDCCELSANLWVILNVAALSSGVRPYCYSVHV